MDKTPKNILLVEDEALIALYEAEELILKGSLELRRSPKTEFVLAFPG